MRRLSMQGPLFYSFFGAGKECFCVFFLVPKYVINMFPEGSSSSQVVPPRQGVPKILFYVVMGPKEVLLLGSDQCSKKLDDGPINMALQKQKTKVVSMPMN